MQKTISPFGFGDLWPAVWMWFALGILALLDCVWILATPLQFDPSGLAATVSSATALFLFSVAGWRHLPPRLKLFMMGTAFVLCAWPALRVFNHLVMTVPLPLSDDLLARWDTNLGLDWRGYVLWVDARPALANAMGFTYLGLTPFSCVVFASLIAFGEIDSAREFLVLFFLSAIIASTVGAVFPAYTAMFHFAPMQQMLQNVTPNYGVSFAPFLDELRQNERHTLQLGNLPGLTSFPSFHTAMALITVYCARHRAALFVPALAFNGLMIASAPVFGGHYFVDIIAGAALVALLAMAVRYLPAGVRPDREMGSQRALFG